MEFGDSHGQEQTAQVVIIHVTPITVALEDNYIGEQAKGKAGVLGSSINPLQYYLANQAGRQKRADELAAEERKRRDEVIGDLRKFQPDQVWNPFYDEVHRYAQANVHDRFYELSGQGKPLSAIERDLTNRKRETNTLANKANWLKSQFEDATDQIDKNPYYKTDEAKSALNDIFFNGRAAKPLSDIKTDEIPTKVFDNVELLNQNNIMIDFMKSLPEKVNQQYTQYWGQLGEQYDVQETKTKLGLQYDDKGRVVIDPRTNQPKISVTDDVLNQALTNPYVRKLLDAYAPDGSTDKQRQVLTALAEGLDPKTAQNRPQQGFKLDDKEKWAKWGWGYNVNPTDLKSRYELLKEVTEKNSPDLIGSLGSILGEVKASYTKHKDVNGQQIPTEITITFPSSTVQASGPDGKPSFADMMTAGQKTLKPLKLSLESEDDRLNARLQLSNLMDKLEKNLGPTEYSKFEREMKSKQPSGVKFTEGKSIPGFH